MSAVPGSKRIAVVQDEETIREGIGAALRREGHTPQPFDDGAAAWAALDADLPDLAILDIGVPRMDGLELYRRLRARSVRLPIVFVTSREEEFDRVLGLELGADDYLCKPPGWRGTRLGVNESRIRANPRPVPKRTDPRPSACIRDWCARTNPRPSA